MIGTLNITATDAEAVPVSITVNGQVHQATVPAHRLLVNFLRDDARADGDQGRLRERASAAPARSSLDGVSVKGCTVLAAQADGAQVTTIEGARDQRIAHAAADGAVERARRPVRVLHAGDGPVADRSAQPNAEAERARDPPVDGRHHLPLRRLPERRPRRPDPHLTRFHGGRRSPWRIESWASASSVAKTPSSFAANRSSPPTSPCRGRRTSPSCTAPSARTHQEHRHLRRGRRCRAWSASSPVRTSRAR